MHAYLEACFALSLTKPLESFGQSELEFYSISVLIVSFVTLNILVAFPVLTLCAHGIFHDRI